MPSTLIGCLHLPYSFSLEGKTPSLIHNEHSLHDSLRAAICHLAIYLELNGLVHMPGGYS